MNHLNLGRMDHSVARSESEASEGSRLFIILAMFPSIVYKELLRIINSISTQHFFILHSTITRYSDLSYLFTREIKLYCLPL